MCILYNSVCLNYFTKVKKMGMLTEVLTDEEESSERLKNERGKVGISGAQSSPKQESIK